MDHVPYGIWGCALRTPEGASAIIVTWITQLSFRPPLVGVVLENGGGFLKHVLKTGDFTLSALPREKGKLIAQKILRQGMDFSQQRNADLFRRDPVWSEAIEGSMAAIRCRVATHHPVGDHTLIVAGVTEEHRWFPGEPLRLADTGWRYRQAFPTGDTTTTD